ncbi:MAG TPA: hypothetical protein VF742_07515 [Terracidiphilus sp.]|jgi:hypothetical protein
MAKDTPNFDAILDLSLPILPEAEKFKSTMSKLLDGKPKDAATVERAFEGQDGMFDLIAAKLYSIASMLVGEGEESIQLVEAAIAHSEVTCCNTAAQAGLSGKRVLAREALTQIAARDAEALASPGGVEHMQTCIEDDDLDAASAHGEEYERALAGPDRERVRTWLESLPTAMRVIFTLRAVAGIPSSETAALLAAYGGPKAAGWSADAVRELFQQALCGLASQVIHEGIKS